METVRVVEQKVVSNEPKESFLIGQLSQNSHHYQTASPFTLGSQQ